MQAPVRRRHRIRACTASCCRGLRLRALRRRSRPRRAGRARLASALVVGVGLAGDAVWPGRPPARRGASSPASWSSLAALRPRPGALSARRSWPGALVVVAAARRLDARRGRQARSFLDWQNWDPYTQPTEPVSVDFVWDSSTTGSDFPRSRRRSSKVEAARRLALLARDDSRRVRRGRWIEESLRVAVGVSSPGRDLLFDDAPLPAQAATRSRWLRSSATSSRRCATTTCPRRRTPVAWRARPRHRPARLGRRRRRQARRPAARRLRTRSGATRAQPTPKAARALEADLPAGRPASAVPRPSRRAATGRAVRHAGPEAEIRAAVRGRPAPMRRRTRRCTGRARSVAGDAKTPVRRRGRARGVVPDRRRVRLRPASAAGSPGVPPLVGFVTKTHARLLPALRGRDGADAALPRDPRPRRGGLHERPLRHREREWIVSDHDAHAWVEVWFRGYGWLPFDPTPARGSFDAAVLDRVGDVRRGRGRAALGAGAGSGSRRLLRLASRAQPAAGSRAASTCRPGRRAASTSRRGGRSAAVGLALLAGLLLVTAIAAVKWTRRRLRYLARDPRRVAAACRRELEELAADQGSASRAAATPAEVAALAARRARRRRRAACATPSRPRASRRPPTRPPGRRPGARARSRPCAATCAAAVAPRPDARARLAPLPQRAVTPRDRRHGRRGGHAGSGRSRNAGRSPCSRSTAARCSPRSSARSRRRGSTRAVARHRPSRGAGGGARRRRLRVRARGPARPPAAGARLRRRRPPRARRRRRAAAPPHRRRHRLRAGDRRAFAQAWEASGADGRDRRPPPARAGRRERASASRATASSVSRTPRRTPI